VKKIPILGLLVGAFVALFALKKKKGGEEAPEPEQGHEGGQA
jgi:hypothetical protein